MHAKLTLRLDEDLVGVAKREARKRGTSVSKMVADYFLGLKTSRKDADELPPVTKALLGSLSGTGDIQDYRNHLEEKYR
jgi:hypothetical protein